MWIFFLYFFKEKILINKCVNLKEKNQIKKFIEIHDLIFFKEYQIKKLIEIHNLR